MFDAVLDTPVASIILDVPRVEAGLTKACNVN